MTRKSTLVISRWSLVVGHLTCREQYPAWDEVLTKMSAGKTKAQKREIFFEDYLQRKKGALQKKVLS